MCSIKIKLCATVAGVMESEYYKEWLNAKLSELKSKISASEVSLLKSVSNVP